MGVKYMQFTVSIHGVDVKDEAHANFMAGWVREAVKACLLGHQKEGFGYRNEFDSDIEVELSEYAGEFDKEVS